MMSKKFQIGITVFLVCFIVAFSGCTAMETVKVQVKYPGSWNGTITDSSGTRNIEGTGDKTIDIGSITGSLKVVVQKKENNTDTLAISAIRGDKTISNMQTTAPEGYTILSVYLTG